jgi:hypothetical protein
LSLQPVPQGVSSTRDRLHQLAYFALAPARFRATGKMGLRATPDGFGTPEFEGSVLRLHGVSLMHESGEEVKTELVTTLNRACEFFDIPYAVDWFTDFGDPLSPFDADEDLALDSEATAFIADWFDFGFRTLTELSGHGSSGDDVSEPQLWPEHFDPAIEMGSEERGQRASYGASPGDHAHELPYVYVSAWGDIDRSDHYWNDSAFNGASLGYLELLASDDPKTTAIDFMLRGYGILHSS